MSDSDINMRVSMDTAAAGGQLDALEERLASLEARAGNIRVGFSSGGGSFNQTAQDRGTAAHRYADYSSRPDADPDISARHRELLEETQREYDAARPSRSSRGAKSVSDLHAEALEENARRDAKEAHDRFYAHYAGGGGRGAGGGYGPAQEEEDEPNGRNPFRVGTRGGLSRGFFNASNQALEGLPAEGAAAIAISAKLMTTATEAALDQAHVLHENETHQRARREGGTYASPEVEAGESRAAQARGVDAFGRRIAGLAGGLGTSIYDSLYGDRLKEIAEVTEARGHADETRAHLSALTGVSNLDLSRQDAGLLPVQIGGAEALEPFGTAAARQFARPMDGRYTATVERYGVAGVNRATVAITQMGMDANNIDLRDRLMEGADVRSLVPEAAGLAAQRGDLNAIAKMRPYLNTRDYDGFAHQAGGILDAQGLYQRDSLRAAGAEQAITNIHAARGVADEGMYRNVGQAIERQIQDLQTKLGRELQAAGETVNTQELRNSISALYGKLGSNAHQAAEEAYGYAGSSNAVGASRTGLTGAQVNLFGGAGDFSNTLLPMQQADVDSLIANEARLISRLPDGAERNQHIAAANNLRAQKMMLPSQAQQADIGRFEEGMNARRAETGLESTTAGLYGGVEAIGAAGEAQRGDNARERQYLQSQLDRATSEPIRQQLRAQIARLNNADVVSYAGESSAQAGVERQVAGARQAQAGFNILGASQFGSDDDVSGAYADSRASRGQTTTAIQARLSDPHLSRDERFALQRELLQQSRGQMQDDIALRGTELSRMDTRHNLVRGDTDFGLTRARALGSASDYRGAVGTTLGELDQEAGDIDAQLARGGLTFDQQASLTRRRQGLRSERFSTEQRGIDEGYSREDLEGYDVARLQLSTRRNIRRHLPFGVGNGLADELEQVGMNRARYGQLEGRRGELARAGNLSPERNMALLREESGLLEENAGIAGELSHGLENYLPNLSSGAPTGFARHNSLSMAAAFRRDAGSLDGSYGFAGGAHAAGQQAALQRMTEGALGHTPMGGGNLPGLQGGLGGDIAGSLNNIAGILQRIEAKGGMGGNGTRASEARAASNGIFAGEGDPGYGFMPGRGGHR